MKKPGQLRSSPLARGSGPRPAPMPKVNRARKAASFIRCYGSAERAEFVRGLPSVWDGAGPCVNAHVGKEGKGARRKANADQIVPLTDAQHRAFDEYRAPFDVVTARVFVVECCPKVQAAWLAHVGAAAA